MVVHEFVNALRLGDIDYLNFIGGELNYIKRKMQYFLNINEKILNKFKQNVDKIVALQSIIVSSF